MRIGITNSALSRERCTRIIEKLQNEGNEIYIITARDKGEICLKENIDILIDDSIGNCLDVAKTGIMAIMLDDKSKKNIHTNIKILEDWDQIYDFIVNDKIIKIINYEDKYKVEVCSFVNESMHKFIGREYKERPDLLNINDYYLKNKGNFWIAIDVKTKKVIGTIALENRQTYGILKRFYVDEEYQNNKVGSKLYEIFYNFVKTNTEINKIYLACGNVLKKAHNFYESKGFTQKDSIDIDMHLAKDDDVFDKDIER